MPKLIRSNLRASLAGVDFDFNIKTGIVLIGGESGTGKTMFYTALSMQALVNRDTQFAFFNYLNSNDIDDSIKKLKNKIIVIDNADVLVKKDLANYIKHDSNNQYILFGRMNIKYGLTREYTAHLVNIERHKIGLKYSW